jgi:hypothetical protein
MHRIAFRCSLPLFLIATAACSGEASAASTPTPTAHFEPPRSLGTPLSEVKRVSGGTDQKEKPTRRSER